MTRVFALALALSLMSCVTQLKAEALQVKDTASSGLSGVEILYGYRCKGCHEPATPGAPDRKELASFEAKEIVDALRSGPMKPLATGLTKQQIRELAAFLTGQSTTSK